MCAPVGGVWVGGGAVTAGATESVELAATTFAGELRTELRAWLSDHLTDEVRAALDSDHPDEAWAAARGWNAELFDAGYAAVSWPSAHGGRDADLVDQLVCAEEMARAGAPGPVNVIGVSNIAPAIMAYGTDEQQERFLRPMLRGDEIWSQGMSEPGAGSDLASLRCRAVADGDHFVVTGQKTWNSNGDRADWCQLYVRTDPDAPKHEGITCLLVDMAIPGIEVRPIVDMAGETGFAEVFLDEARIPRSALLGGVGEGWRVATRTLSNERAGVATMYLHLRRKLDDLTAELTPLADPVARQELAARHIDARVLELLARRMLGAMLAGKMPGPEGSVIKMAWSGAEQALASTAVALTGGGQLDGRWPRNLMTSRSLSIAGGTTEVNRTIVAERVLGLPREPRPDPGT